MFSKSRFFFASMIALSSGILSPLAQAVPHQMKLAAPSRIVVLEQEGRLELTFLLPCNNDWALDWSQVVMTSDDEGDMAAAVGLIYSAAPSVCGPSSELKEFKLVVDPADYFYPFSRTPGGYVPMHLAQ